MKFIVKSIITVFLVLFTINTSAQVLRSSYFLEGASLRHQMNPAFQSENNYISIPLIGNTVVDIQGNVGLSNFIYEIDNPNYELTTFLNPSLNRDAFLNKLHDNNRLNIGLNLTLLSFGFHAWNGFNTVELGVKSNTSLNIPYALFDFMKTGMSNGKQEYNIKDLSLRSTNYAELAFGHARTLSDKLQVGAKFKILIGGAGINAQIDDMYVKMNEDEWEVRMHGDWDASLKGGAFKTRKSSDNTRYLINGFDVNSPGIGGFGAGIDLGAIYALREDITLSAAILDFGFISWNNALRGYNDGIPFKFNGFENLVIKSESSSSKTILREQFDDVIDDAKDMLMFYDKGETGGRATMLATTVNLGAEYVFPYYDKMTFGLLSSTRINGIYTWSEARLSANVSPLKWFNTALSYGLSNYGSSLGWALNFHPANFNAYLGFDYLATTLTPQFLPVNKPNFVTSIGFNVTY
ncbi:hypothetical protein EZS27_013606 [termite gut metagenome]|uniref:DUF5723 domain-containing protein n=1 Tax=termite gut metagenome TaxID=433724 RepID=A0A5J4RZ79_9ZZZZ